MDSINLFSSLNPEIVWDIRKNDELLDAQILLLRRRFATHNDGLGLNLEVNLWVN